MLPINVEIKVNSTKSVGNTIIDVVKETMKNDYLKYSFLFAYPDKPFMGNNKYIYYTIPQAVNKYKVNNTVLLMLTDWGYMNQFWNSYIVSDLKQYSNLVVACLDTQVYEVMIALSMLFRLSMTVEYKLHLSTFLLIRRIYVQVSSQNKILHCSNRNFNGN